MSSGYLDWSLTLAESVECMPAGLEGVAFAGSSLWDAEPNMMGLSGCGMVRISDDAGGTTRSGFAVALLWSAIGSSTESVTLVAPSMPSCCDLLSASQSSHFHSSRWVRPYTRRRDRGQ